MSVVPPTPDDGLVDLSITIVDILFLFFILGFIFTFLKVAMSLAFESFSPNPFILSWDELELNSNLSWVNISFSPSDLVRVYLPSSKGRKFKSFPAIIISVELFSIVTSYSFLIVRLELCKFTEDMYCLGKNVYNLFWSEMFKEVFNTLKSFTFKVELCGKDPSHTPWIEVTEVIPNELLLTETTEAKDGTINSGVEYETISPTLTEPIKIKLDEVTVDIPEDSWVIDADPIVVVGVNFTSELKVDAAPTNPWIDLTSDIE